jgi:formylglycine-generating enzyme required for sulfatase activity
MKNKTTALFVQRFGIIASIAIIGFSFGACKDGSDTGGETGGGRGTAPTITTTSLEDGKEGTPYSETLTATGDEPITWSIINGDLPDGLTLNGAKIEGEPTEAETATFTVKATNKTGSDTKELKIRILTASGKAAPTITTTSLPDGTVGEEYTATLAATGDDTITWSIEGDLPDGLELDEDEGTITGTPTEADTFTFTVKAKNAVGPSTKELSITIEPADDDGDDGVAPTITTTSLPDGTVGEEYTATLAATGDDTITWSIEEGDLPDGLELVEDTITGTPTEADTFTFTVKAENDEGEDTKEFTITIAYPPLEISTESLPDGVVGVAYSQTLAAEGATPISWFIDDSGALPAGLRLSEETGVISGTPMVDGKSTFTVIATNDDGEEDTRELSITVALIIEMVTIEGGTYTMGSPTDEPNRTNFEVQHQVKLTNDYYMGKYPVMQAQYYAVMKSNPSEHRRGGTRSEYLGEITDTASFPVEYVNWYDAIVFCNKLSMKEGKSPAYSMYKSDAPGAATSNPSTNPGWSVSTNWSTDPDDWGAVPTARSGRWSLVVIVANSAGYRLPTEAQWECACRAGTTTAFNWDSNTITTNQANYNGNTTVYNNSPNPQGYLQRTTRVGSYAPNELGLYDMHGNVSEWCWDWYGGNYVNGEVDPMGGAAPTAPNTGGTRTLRGGSWFNTGNYARSACQDASNPGSRFNSVGFRLVLPAQ